MSSRRRYLLETIANAYKWLKYYYSYLFYDLVPNKIATFNKWDEEWVYADNRIYSKNYIPVALTQTYYVKCPTGIDVRFFDVNYNDIKNGWNWYPLSNPYITIPDNCRYIKFRTTETYGTTYNHDICINESDTQMNGIYAPYQPRKVKGKTRLGTIYGNGMVVNQAIAQGNLPATETKNGITLTNNNDGSVSLSGTAWDNTFFDISNKPTIIKDRYYLFLGGDETTYGLNSYDSNIWGERGIIANKIVKALASGQPFTWRVYVAYNTVISTPITIRPQFVDLTKTFGSGREPTSMTDPRIIRLIAYLKDHPEYNEGTYLGTTIKEIVCEGFNIWDEEWELGNYDTTTGQKITGNRIINKNIIKVLPNTTYYIFTNHETASVNVLWYDINGNYIDYNQRRNSTVVSPSNAYWANISTNYLYTTTYNHDICINRSSSLNGTYLPHIPSQFLPKEYQEVEYLESTGTQYIDSGIGFANGYYGKAEFSYTTIGNYFAVAGAEGSEPYGTRNTISICANGLLYGGAGVDMNTNIEIEIGKKYSVYTKTVTDGNDFIYVDGVLKATGSNTSTRYSGNIYIGGLNKNGEFLNSYAFRGKIYKVQFYDNNNILIRNFIPCVRKSDNVAGLFDLVNRTFYTNQGTGTFKVGKNVNNNTKIVLPAPVKLNGALDSHDEFTVENDAYVFTHNTFSVDLGSLTWATSGTDTSGQKRFSASLNNAKQSDTNNGVSSLCSKYMPLENGGTYEASSLGYTISGSSDILIRDVNYNSYSTTDFKTAMTGQTITYTFNTPQTIRIPKKHLGWVRLRDLDWIVRGGSGSYPTSPVFQSTDIISLVKKPASSGDMANIYCSAFMTTTWTALTGTVDMSMSIAGDGYLDIRDLSCATVNDFLAKHGNEIIFFETQDETTDFLNECVIQSGGTVTGAEYSWVENQLVENGNFTSTNNWVSVGGRTTFDVLNGVASLTPNAQSTGENYVQQSIPMVIGHKYLLAGNSKAQAPTDLVLAVFYGEASNHQYLRATSSNWEINATIFECASNTYNLVRMYNNYTDTSKVIYFKDIRLVDLTIGFPDGDIPTSIDDPRIQDIIAKGYIPTNKTGTETIKDCVVLPNAMVEDKCK